MKPMKVKAIILNPDHTNTVVKMTKKNRTGMMFQHNTETYMLNNDDFQITHSWVGVFFRRKYITYYYAHNQTKPLPISKIQNFKQNGVQPDELKSIFNPWFLRVISPSPLTWQDQMFRLMQLGTFLGVIYLIYILSGMEQNIIDGVWERFNPPVEPETVNRP